LDEAVRDGVLDHMQAQGKNKAVGFVGPFDAVMRCGANPKMSAGVDAWCLFLCRNWHSRSVIGNHTIAWG
jgi:hypothetical protein